MMRAVREPMTIAQLKRSMDARFKHIDQRFKRVDVELRRLRQEMRRQSEETRRHFDVVAESLRDDMRMFAEAISMHSKRLGDHDVRLRRLEQPRTS